MRDSTSILAISGMSSLAAGMHGKDITRRYEAHTSFGIWSPAAVFGTHWTDLDRSRRALIAGLLDPELLKAAKTDAGTSVQSNVNGDLRVKVEYAHIVQVRYVAATEEGAEAVVRAIIQRTVQTFSDGSTVKVNQDPEVVVIPSGNYGTAGFITGGLLGFLGSFSLVRAIDKKRIRRLAVRDQA